MTGENQEYFEDYRGSYREVYGMVRFGNEKIEDHRLQISKFCFPESKYKQIRYFFE